MGILSESDRPRKYWSDLKSKLKQEGNEVSEKIGQLKLKSNDGKYHITDVCNIDDMFNKFFLHIEIFIETLKRFSIF